jgi:hypothetical protein
MKKFMIFLMMTSFLANFSFASSADLGQNSTDCDMMRETNDRTVVNKGTVAIKPPTSRPSGSTRL